MLGNFSLSNLFYSFDVDILAYIAIFFLLFAGITFLLKRTLFKDSRGVLIAISASSSLLAMYGLIRANFSIAELFFKLNLPPELQYNLAWIIFILVFLILWVKYGFGICLMLVGAGLIIIGSLELVYADTEFIIVGSILFIIGYFLWRKKKGKKIPKLKVFGGGFGGNRNKTINKNRYYDNRKYDNRRYNNRKYDKIKKKTINREDNPQPKPNPRKPMGEASLDVIVGGRSIKGGRATLDLTNSDTTIIYVKNGGTGGKLGWRASCNNELGLSKTQGKLAVGKYHEIKVKVRKRDGREYASVIINGRGGGRLGGRATRGRVMITFKVGLKKR